MTNVFPLGEFAPVLAHVLSFVRNPRGSPDLLAHPVAEAFKRCGLGTWVLRYLGVAHTTLSTKAAQAVGCSLNPELRVTFCRPICITRAASAPGLWTLGFLLL